MKKLLRIPLLLAAMFLTSIPLSAHDFEVNTGGHSISFGGGSSTTIYYNITDATAKTVEVTYAGITYSKYLDEYKGNVSIPETVVYNDVTYTVTSIGNNAFRKCIKLENVKIPNTVTSIGEYAFNDCLMLDYIAIGKSVNKIGSYAFNNDIETVNISDLAAWCKIDFHSTPFSKKGGELKLNGTLITDLIIPNDVSEIKNLAFLNCTSITSVTIPNSVTSIESRAFHGCTGLTLVTIPNSVTTIGYDAFGDCRNLTEVNYNAENCATSDVIFSDCPIKIFNLGQNVKTIPKYLCKDCTSLASISLPNSVTTIGYGAFFGCTRLTSVTIPNSVTSIGGGAFEGCTGLTSVTIPNSVTEIGDYAFRDCSNLVSVTIPEGVSSIREDTFYGCTSLTSVIIPESVTKIGRQAFKDCRNASFVIPSTVTEIEEGAFLNCDKLLRDDFGWQLYVINTTQTTVAIKPRYSSTQFMYTPVIEIYNYANDYYPFGKCALNEKITGLTPNTRYYLDIGVIINDIVCPVYVDEEIYTSNISFNFTGSTTVTTLTASCSPSGDVTIQSYGINVGNPIEYNNQNSIIKAGLDPNTTYTVYYGVKIMESSSAYTTSTTFTTGALEWSAGEYQATSTTSVRLMTETNCDATAGTGIEWRRYGAPESLAPNKAECPVVDGMLVGFLKGLNSEAYYEYRPYYTSASGKTYYGEWAAFFSGDAGVYFEPEVRTFTESSVDGNSATIKGYALPGTDEVTGQGFEYWKTSGISTYSTDNIKTVLASGISMSVTLSGLDYNSTYCYRAFVTTAKGTTYGDTVEFSTGYPAGIYTVDADNDKNTASYRILPGMLVVNGEGETPVMVADMNGRVLFNGYAAGQLELPLKAGIYILRLGNNAHKVAIR